MSVVFFTPIYRRRIVFSHLSKVNVKYFCHKVNNDQSEVLVLVIVTSVLMLLADVTSILKSVPAPLVDKRNHLRKEEKQLIG